MCKVLQWTWSVLGLWAIVGSLYRSKKTQSQVLKFRKHKIPKTTVPLEQKKGGGSLSLVESWILRRSQTTRMKAGLKLWCVLFGVPYVRWDPGASDELTICLRVTFCPEEGHSHMQRGQKTCGCSSSVLGVISVLSAKCVASCCAPSLPTPNSQAVDSLSRKCLSV